MLTLKNIPLSAWLGLIVTGLFVFAAVFAPWVAPFPNAAIVGDVWEPMSSAHWLGTDNLGRDLLSRMIYGARTTILIAALATALSFTMGRYSASPQRLSAAGSTRPCRAGSTC